MILYNKVIIHKFFIIDAHSIQNNGILDKLSENGKVICIDRAGFDTIKSMIHVIIYIDSMLSSWKNTNLSYLFLRMYPAF